MTSALAAQLLATAHLYWVESELREPVRTSRGEFSSRSSALVRIETLDGVAGWGEFSPWPPVRNRVDDFAAAFATLKRGGSADDAAARFDSVVRPAARCAFETALGDIAARCAGVPLYRYLGSDAVLDHVRVNAFGRATPGFDTIKIKVGAGSSADDIRDLEALRAHVGATAAIRIDANGAWTPDEAVAALEPMSVTQIEFVEQPVPADDVSGLARVRREAGVRVVADEAITDIPSLESVIDAGAADGVMLKIARVGGPAAAVVLGRRARTAGLEVYVSSSFEFAVGVVAGIHTAAAVAAHAVHGLATSPLLRQDVAVLTPHDGIIDIPAGPGLGIAPDADRLARIATDVTSL